MTINKPSLDAAYALETPEDNRLLYADWASSYDAEFADAMDYQLPGHVARMFDDLNRGEAPVLDVGAGTGLVAQLLAGKISCPIDGLDISAEMLATARAKGLYSTTIVADLTQPLPIRDGAYSAIVSSGTFTHGHVGPDALDELMRIAAPDALFVLSVNAEHFEARGFAGKFSALADRITDYQIHPVSIYGPGANDDHRSDIGNIVTFRKLDPARNDTTGNAG